MLKRFFAPIAALWMLVGLMAAPALAAQDGTCLPTSSLSGLAAVNDINSALSAVFSSNSGSSSPTDPCTSTAPIGMVWYDSSNNLFKMSDGTGSWLTVGFPDATNHVWTPIVGGGVVNSIASATTTDLCSAKPLYVSITGTTTITSFGSNCVIGQLKKFVFTGILTLTHNATSLILPNNGSNITTAAGAIGEAVYLGSGNWRVTNYMPAAGPCSTCALLGVADQTITGGANVNSDNLGTVSSGTTTIDCGARPLQYLTDNGAFTLAAPSNDGSCMLLVTNGASAGAITFSGFTVGASTGAALDTTNTHKFTLSIWRINGTAAYSITAHQ